MDTSGYTLTREYIWAVGGHAVNSHSSLDVWTTPRSCCAAAHTRALVRAVDGTALVFTRLDQVERERLVAEWSLRLHAAEKGRLSAQLHWLRHLDDEDRDECLDELWEALEDVHSDDDRAAFDVAVHEWRNTARALADADRREVLLGTVAAEDFEPAARPQ
jgi:hypothetical protein